VPWCLGGEKFGFKQATHGEIPLSSARRNSPKHFTAESSKIAKTHQLSTAGAQRWAKMFRAAPRFVSGRSFEAGDFFASLRFNRPFWDPEATPQALALASLPT